MCVPTAFEPYRNTQVPPLCRVKTGVREKEDDSGVPSGKGTESISYGLGEEDFCSLPRSHVAIKAKTLKPCDRLKCHKTNERKQ